MSTGTREIIRLCEALPEEKRETVVGFARFLLSREEHPDDAAWERLLADDRPRPKLETFARASEAEGEFKD
jgi:hypothetical protein